MEFSVKSGVIYFEAKVKLLNFKIYVKIIIVYIPRSKSN